MMPYLSASEVIIHKEALSSVSSYLPFTYLYLAVSSQSQGLELN